MSRAGAGRGVGRAVALVLALGLAGAALAGCGGGDDPDARVLPAGEVDIQLPRGYEVVDGKAVRPSGGAEGGGSAAGGRSTTTTIPLTRDDDPTTALFSALAKFRGCLDGLGVEFRGAPDGSNPSSPTNDPKYIEALSTCAARSNVVQALQTAQSANEGLTPDEIETRNKAYLRWRTCMIDRGWKVPAPVPDAQGRLFNFGTSSGDQIQGPPGKDLLSSNDVQECAERAQRRGSNGAR